MKLEFLKNKRRKLSLLFPALLLLQVLYLCWGMNRNDHLSQGWIMQLYNLPIINAILLPTVIAVFASRLFDVEHKGNTRKILETLQSKERIFFNKILFGFCHLFCFCLLQTLCSLVIGAYFCYKGTPDLWAYGLYFLCTLLPGFILFFLQSLCSFLFTNQAVSLSLGLCGSMAGLFLLYLPRSILYELVPWGLFGASMFVGMDWNPATRATHFYYSYPQKGISLSLILWIAGLILISVMILSKTDLDSSLSVLRKKRKTAFALHCSKLPAEWIKIKRTPIWIAFMTLPAISAFIGTFNYLGNIAILDDGWYSLWSQHTLFLCYFFMPPLIGIFCSYLWRMEHTGTNWNLIMTLSSPWKIVRDKLLVSVFMTALTLLWTVFLFWAGGRFAHLHTPLPNELIEWVIYGFFGAVAICAVQIFLSLVIQNFAVPIAIALAGGIFGLILSAKGFWYLLPYSLLSMGMRANNPYYKLKPFLFLAASAIFFILFYLLSVCYLKKVDVKTQA